MNTNSVVSIAERILVESGKPLHYKELTKMLINECNLTGKTPYETVRSLIGTNPKFKRVAEGVYGLAVWRQYPAARFAKDIAYDILVKKGKPMDLENLGLKIFLERRFVSQPSMIVRNIIHTDKRFYYDPKLGQVCLVDWKKKK